MKFNLSILGLLFNFLGTLCLLLDIFLEDALDETAELLSKIQLNDSLSKFKKLRMTVNNFFISLMLGKKEVSETGIFKSTKRRRLVIASIAIILLFLGLIFQVMGIGVFK